MVFIFGIGGGSDMPSARLVALKIGCPDAVIFTSLKPVLTPNGAVDREKTILKYSGSNSTTIEGSRTPSAVWCVTGDHPPPALVFKHSIYTNVYGIVVAPFACIEAFAQCSSALRALVVSITEGAIGGDVIAVDTGGDCLRGWVAGFGARDVSYLYGGELDSRDHDTLLMIAATFGESTIKTYILGPGSDGETSNTDLIGGLQTLRCGTADATLLHEGAMQEFESIFALVPEWSQPIPGSTISNIRKALDRNISDADLVHVTRRGDVFVGEVQANILRSYCVVEIRTVREHMNRSVAI